MAKKNRRPRVCVRSRQVLQPQNHQVIFPREQSHTGLVPTLAQVDYDNDNDNEPSRFGQQLVTAIIDSEVDDQPVLHIDNIQDDMDEDGVIDPNDDSGTYLDMSDWETD
jgi:hypothetical protein